VKHTRSAKALLVALVALVALALAGCGAGAGGSDQSGAAAGKPVSGGSVTWGVESLPLTLNPQVNGQNKAKLLMRNQFDSLVGRDKGGRFVPWLATSWTISPDGLTYTLKLREGVKFHDGTPFDAAAVKANFDKMKDPKYTETVATVNLAQLKQTDVVDDHTVRFVLREPRASFLDFLSHPNSGLISPKSLRGAKNLTAGGVDVVGTGPFVLERYVEGQELVYKKNPDYTWGPASAAHKGPAYLDQVTYRFLPEASVRVGALSSRQVDVIEGVPSTEIDLFKKDPAYIYSSALNSGSPYSLYFNLSKAPTNDIRVRRAFREAVDLEAVLKSVYFGHAVRAWAPVSKTSPFYDASLEKKYGGDVKLANQLLDQAGWTGRDAQGFRTKAGERLTLRLVASAPFIRDRRDVLLQAIQAAVKQSAGIDFDVKIADQGTATKAQDDNAYEVFQNSRGDQDAGDAIELLWSSKGGINLTHLNDPLVDSWIAEAKTATEQGVRVRDYHKLQQYGVLQQAIVFPLYVPADQIAARKEVHGLGFQHAGGVPDGPYDVWIEH
jgi:peptide/nickel transport system substrate-binding protein